MEIRLSRVHNIEGFEKALNNCNGRVELKTKEGDLLNLRSELSKLISINTILDSVSELDNITIHIEREKDAVILMQYIAGEKIG